MKKEIKQNIYGLDEYEILGQVKREYKMGYESVSAKRKIREEDIKNKYVPIATEDKINIHSIYTTIQTLMSVYYSDNMVVEFSGRKNIYIEQAAQINRLAEFDYDEMELDKLDYLWNWNRFFHGVGIKIINGYDGYTQTPTPKIMNTLSWIPDPRGGFTIDDHRWCGFEVSDTKENMEACGYMNVDLVNSANENVQSEIRSAYMDGRSIINNYVDDTPNKKYDIYNHYTIIEGYKYLITTANHSTLILRMIRLEPATKEERDNPLKVPFPVALKYYSPLESDPIGISVPDLLKDKQSAESKLFNLTLISATRNALGDDKIYNPKKIRNVNDLKIPTVGGKFIAANINDGENLGSVIMSVPKENPTNLPFDMQSSLRFQSSISTGMDSTTLGIQGDGNQTATEAQITQKNANLRFILGTKIGKWGEESFWKLWYRSYIYNLKSRSKKAIRIQKGFDTKYYEIGRKDFITSENINIKIVSKSELESMRNKEKNDFFSIAPQFLGDPSSSNLSKLYIKRKMFRLMGLSEEEIMRIVPLSLDERIAHLDVELINNNQRASDPIKGQDHLTFIDILELADDNKYKAEAISKRSDLMIEEGNDELAQITNQENDNTMNNIAQSNASSKMSANMLEQSKENSTPSLQNI